MAKRQTHQNPIRLMAAIGIPIGGLALCALLHGRHAATLALLVGAGLLVLVTALAAWRGRRS